MHEPTVLAPLLAVLRDLVAWLQAGMDGRLAQAENRHAELMARCERRRQELERQRSLTLQAVERIASILVLPHPEREALDIRGIRPNPETEATAMRVVI